MLDIRMLRSLSVDNRHVTHSPLHHCMDCFCSPVAPARIRVFRRRPIDYGAGPGGSPFHKVARLHQAMIMPSEVDTSSTGKIYEGRNVRSRNRYEQQNYPFPPLALRRATLCCRPE